MSAVITIPLEKNKEISALVADKQPADTLYGCFTIKAKDDQSLVLRVKELTDNKEDLPEKEEYDEEDEDGGEGEDESDEEEYGNGSSPSETEEAIRLASPMGGPGSPM